MCFCFSFFELLVLLLSFLWVLTDYLSWFTLLDFDEKIGIFFPTLFGLIVYSIIRYLCSSGLISCIFALVVVL
ncbi:hypothetical protein DsansV1_C05g0054981 [Dioscorea sansibarensis]